MNIRFPVLPRQHLPREWRDNTEPNSFSSSDRSIKCPILNIPPLKSLKTVYGQYYEGGVCVFCPTGGIICLFVLSRTG